jgi:hypothetical protein
MLLFNETTEVGFVRRESDGFPICLKCNRPVDEWDYETPVERIHSWNGSSMAVHTGEIIVTIKCHGETWRASNFRGRLS